jgi:hypothetical protein
MTAPGREQLDGDGRHGVDPELVRFITARPGRQGNRTRRALSTIGWRLSG